MQEQSLFTIGGNNKISYNVDFSNTLEISRSKKSDFKPILRYNNEKFRFLIFTDFTALDFDIFMCLCFAANEKGNLKIKISFEDLNFLMDRGENQKINKNAKRLCQKFNDFAEKATKTIIKITESNGNFDTNTYTGFFDFIKVYEKEKIIIVQFNDLMVSVLNVFVDNYTKLELKQYCKLQSKYAKQLYALLISNLYISEKIGLVKFSKDELIKYLSLQKLKLQQESDFDKILDNAKELIKTLIYTIKN